MSARSITTVAGCAFFLLATLFQPCLVADDTKDNPVKLKATVEGFTQAVEFNQQKYPFKYTGTSSLMPEQLRLLSKKGDVPDDVSKALLACLLDPDAKDTLTKAALKSDGTQFTGVAVVNRKIGKQGTHTLTLTLEGTIADQTLTLKLKESTVKGTWDYGGGTIELKGEVKVAFSVTTAKKE